MYLFKVRFTLSWIRDITRVLKISFNTVINILKKSGPNHINTALKETKDIFCLAEGNKLWRFMLKEKSNDGFDISFSLCWLQIFFCEHTKPDYDQ